MRRPAWREARSRGAAANAPAIDGRFSRSARLRKSVAEFGLLPRDVSDDLALLVGDQRFDFRDSILVELTRHDRWPPRALTCQHRSLSLVATQAEYFAPARMDDILEVRTWVSRIGRTSLSLRHEIVRIEAADNTAETLLVRGREDRVFVGHGLDGLRPRELTPRMRQALARFFEPGVTAGAGSDGLQRS